jgi:hypothetical protein
VCGARMALYSGIYRPAWRIIHTGTQSTFSPRQARLNRVSVILLVMTGHISVSTPLRNVGGMLLACLILFDDAICDRHPLGLGYPDLF